MSNLNSLHDIHRGGFSILPVCILKDDFREGRRRYLIKLNDIFKPNGKSIVQSVSSSLSAGFVFTPYHYHEGIEILRITDGEGSVIINNRAYPAKRDDIFIANAYEAHGIFLPDEHSSFSRICITFQPSALFSQMEEKGFFADLRNTVFANHIPSGTPAGARLCACIDGIISLLEKGEDGWQIAAFGNLVMFYYFAVHEGLTEPESSATPPWQSEFMLRVSRYIDDHLDEDIATTDIAAYCQYTTEHFCRLFKRCFGRTFKNYLGAYRVQKAVSLMDSAPDSTVTEIASVVGFNNQNHFCNVFKRNVGVLPSEYLASRREHGSTDLPDFNNP